MQNFFLLASFFLFSNVSLQKSFIFLFRYELFSKFWQYKTKRWTDWDIRPTIHHLYNALLGNSICCEKRVSLGSLFCPSSLLSSIVLIFIIFSNFLAIYINTKIFNLIYILYIQHLSKIKIKLFKFYKCPKKNPLSQFFKWRFVLQNVKRN